MKLHELVALRNQLACALEVATLNQELEKNCDRLYNLSKGIEETLSNSIVEIANEHKNISSLVERDLNKIQELLVIIQDRIDVSTAHFFAENYQLELQHFDADTIRQIRILPYDKKFQQVITQRINLYSNWKYPALEIGCRDGEWTKMLVASDPLYISDFYEDFFQSASEQFPPVYQGRLRKYLITDFCKIANLPKNQFGLIFSYNFFNYLSIDSIKQLLIQALEWLRPGGLMMFTYNNADLPAAAGHAESYYMTFVPKSILVPLAESLGFEITFSFDDDPAFSFIEFKKPGKLKSIKAAQTVGEIKLRQILDEFDNPDKT